MGNALDVELQDEDTVEEIRLVTELMVVAASAPGELEQDVIDDALGVEDSQRPFPNQRQRRLSGRPTNRTLDLDRHRLHGDSACCLD